MTRAVEDVGQHSYVQTEALKEKQETLSSLQVHLLHFMCTSLTRLVSVMHFDFALVISGININSIFYSYHIITALSKGSQWLVFQATLSDIETRGETAEQELRSKVRETLVLEGDMEQLQRQTKVLHGRYTSISKENTELQILICEEEDSARVALDGFNSYRYKMEVHRAAVLHAASHTEAYKELEEKRALVRM